MDPSGNIVTIGGVNVEDINAAINSGDYMRMLAIARATANDRDILIGYGTLRGVAPVLTEFLEGAEQEITIDWYEGEITGFAHADVWDSLPGDLITGISTNLKNEDPRAIVGALGHELFHQMLYLEIGLRGNYAANEAFAYAFGNTVGWMLGYDMGKINPIHYQFQVINPFSTTGSSDSTIGYANQMLASFGYNYEKPYEYLWPMQGKDKFLTVAQTYWLWGEPSPWSWVY